MQCQQEEKSRPLINQHSLVQYQHSIISFHLGRLSHLTITSPSRTLALNIRHKPSILSLSNTQPYLP